MMPLKNYVLFSLDLLLLVWLGKHQSLQNTVVSIAARVSAKP